MALKIKLSRQGRNKVPVYRVVVLERCSKNDGKYVDLVGHYNPATHPVTLQLNREKTSYWISKGAKPTPTVAYLLQKENFLWTKDFTSAKPIPIKKKKTKKEREQAKQAQEKQKQETPPSTDKPAPKEEKPTEVTTKETTVETPGAETTQ